jgi:hypothetical protein
VLKGWAFGAAFNKHLHELESGYAAELCLDDDVCSDLRPNPNPNPYPLPLPLPLPYTPYPLPLYTYPYPYPYPNQVCNGFRLLYCTVVSLCCAFVISVV